MLDTISFFYFFLRDGNDGVEQPHLVDPSRQNQAESASLLAIHGYPSVVPHRHHVLGNRTHHHQHHGAAVDVFHLENELPVSYAIRGRKVVLMLRNYRHFQDWFL